MQEYSLILKNEKISRYTTTKWVFLVFNLAASVFLAVNKNSSSISFYLLLFIPLTVLVVELYLKRVGAKNRFEIIWLILMIPWITVQLYWVAAAILMFGIFHHISMRKLRVVVTREVLIYPSFPEKNLTWNELKNVILKDGLLTIDLKNNTLIQQPVEDETSSVNEQEFNEFCCRQLAFTPHA